SCQLGGSAFPRLSQRLHPPSSPRHRHAGLRRLGPRGRHRPSGGLRARRPNFPNRPMNRRVAIRLAMAAIGLLLTACPPGHRQSALHPAADAAGRIGTLWWVMFAVLAASFVLVMALTWLAVVRAPTGRSEQDKRRTRRLVIGGGFVFPGVVLLGMLFYSLGTS